MGDIVTTMAITFAAGAWGAIGGIVWWAMPKRPDGPLAFVQRVAVGFAAGAIWYALGGITPFLATGEWDASGVGKLIAAGYTGLAGVAALLPTHLNEDFRAQTEETAKTAATRAPP